MKMLSRNRAKALWRTVAMLAILCGTCIAQSFNTTTVHGTVFLAGGQPASGTLQVSWPAFTTADQQAVAAGRTSVSIGQDGSLSVKLAPNQGASPAGLFYTAVYHLNDGTTSTEYWVVPATADAELAQVRAQVMPAAQAVQAVSKAYVDQSVQLLTQSLLTASGGDLSGPLYLSGDPTTARQAATKQYVDNSLGQAIPKTGGTATGPLTAPRLGAVYQADQFAGADFGGKLQACIDALDRSYGGTCDARNFPGNIAMSAPVSIVTGNITVDLPCATIATSSPMVIAPGVRNVTLHGCASRATSSQSGSEGGTLFLYSGDAAMVQVGDSSYAIDTPGFHLDNVGINTTAASAPSAQAIAAWRTQELHLASLYLLGNPAQTGITLDGTGNYSGGSLDDVEIVGFGTGVRGIGHQVANSAATDWLNASTFVRLHIVCPTANGGATDGTVGIDLQQGDGNTFTGGDVESCATALHLGPNAQNNTVVGLRNENSTYQVVADAGSAYNSWMTGGTMFTGRLSDNGTRNSFLDTFHRSFNALNGDWFGTQQDATLTNHYRLGIGTGNERGLLHRYQTDSGYRWTMGLSDATAGEQFYQVLDELNNVYRLSIGQYNNGQSSTNNQTVINAAGSGAIVLNGSKNSGTGGVVFGAGGSNGATVATINGAGNAQFNGTLQVNGPSTFQASTTVRNQADAEVDAFLWAGSSAPQKESFIYKDWNGASQWYLVKDASNNWALNSAIGGLDSFKAYQSSNSGDTYVNASNVNGTVRINYESGSGAAFNIYGGGSSNLYASFTGVNAIKFPGLAAGSGHNCLQIDDGGYLSNTGAACSGSSGTVGSGSAGQIAYYSAAGDSLAGLSTVPLSAGGTGASDAATALRNLGGISTAGGTLSGELSAPSFNGTLNGTATHAHNLPADLAVQSAQDPRAATFASVSTGSASQAMTIGPLSLPLPWTLDTTTPTTALQSMVPGVTPDGSNGFTAAGTAASVRGNAAIGQGRVNIGICSSNSALATWTCSQTDAGISSNNGIAKLTSLNLNNSTQYYGSVDLDPMHGTFTSGTETPGVYNVSTPIVVGPGVIYDCHNAVVNWIGSWGSVAGGTIHPSGPFILAGPFGNGNPRGEIRNCRIANHGNYRMQYPDTDGSGNPNYTFAILLGGDPNGILTSSAWWGANLSATNNVITGFNAGIALGNNSMLSDFYSNGLYGNLNAVGDGTIFPCGTGPTGSGELIRIIGGQVTGNAGNGMMLNCGSQWALDNTSIDYSVSQGWMTAKSTAYRGAPSASSQLLHAEISGFNVNVTASNTHLEHYAGALVQPASAGIFSMVGGMAAINANGITGPTYYCQINDSHTATFSIQSTGYGPIPPAGSYFQVASSTCPGVNGVQFSNAVVTTAVNIGGTNYINVQGTTTATLATTAQQADTGTFTQGKTSPTACAITNPSTGVYIANITVPNAYIVGQDVTPSGLTTCTALNGQTLRVGQNLSGLTSDTTRVIADVSSVNGISVVTGSETGSISVPTDTGYFKPNHGGASGGSLFTSQGTSFSANHPVTYYCDISLDPGTCTVNNEKSFGIYGGTNITNYQAVKATGQIYTSLKAVNGPGFLADFINTSYGMGIFARSQGMSGASKMSIGAGKDSSTNYASLDYNYNSGAGQTATVTLQGATVGTFRSTGAYQLKTGTLLNFGTCTSALEGANAAITDSTTTTFGATITGGGTNHVAAYCNGTNWVVN